MKSVIFPQQNCLLGRDQVGLKAVPAFVGTLDQGVQEAVACFELTPEEIGLLASGGGKLWYRQFIRPGGAMLPMLLQVDDPFLP